MARSKVFVGYKWVFVAAMILGMGVAHLSLALYKVSPFGPVPQLDLAGGWLVFYARQVAIRYPSIGWLIAGWTH